MAATLRNHISLLLPLVSERRCVSHCSVWFRSKFNIDRSLCTASSTQTSGSQIQARCLTEFKVVKLHSQSLVRLSGTDVSPFLQGLITNDIHCLDNDCQSLYTMILNIKGRVLCDLIIYNYPQQNRDVKLVEVATSQTQLLLKLFKKYKLRKKVNIELLASNGVPSASVYSAFGCVKERPVGDNSYQVYRDPRLSHLGYRIIKEEDGGTDLDSEIYTDETVYKQHRYRLGVGEGPLEHIPEKALPLECNLAQLNGVSFTKGCYIGQELTARSHHTGVIRKRIMPIQTKSSCELEANTEVKLSTTGKTVGYVRGHAGNCGIALLRLSNVLRADTGLYVNDTSGNKIEVEAQRPHWWPDNLAIE